MERSNNSQPAQSRNGIKHWITNAAARAQPSPPSRPPPSSKKPSVQLQLQKQISTQTGSTSSLVANTGLVSPHISSASSSDFDDSEWEKIDLKDKDKPSKTTTKNSTSSKKPKKPDSRANQKMDQFGDAFKPTLKK